MCPSPARSSTAPPPWGEQASYQQIPDAGHPPVERLDIDAAEVSGRLRADLEQAHSYRPGLTAETLGIALHVDPVV